MANVQSTTSNLAGRAAESASQIYKSARNASDEVSSTVTTEFRNFVTDVEDFLKKIGTGATSNFSDARAQVEQKLSAAKAQLASAQESARSGMRATEDYVQSHPWRTIGLAAAIGIVIGLLASSSSSSSDRD